MTTNVLIDKMRRRACSVAIAPMKPCAERNISIPRYDAGLFIGEYAVR